MHKKILIVDDEPDILEFLSYNFYKGDFQVYTASNGLEGIERATAEMPDIIISDILMPEMDGIAMCKELRKKQELNQTPILFLSAVQDDYQLMHAMYAGGDQYLAKPIRFNYLLSIVNSLIKEESVTKTYLNAKRITNI